MPYFFFLRKYLHHFSLHFFWFYLYSISGYISNDFDWHRRRIKTKIKLFWNISENLGGTVQNNLYWTPRKYHYFFAGLFYFFKNMSSIEQLQSEIDLLKSRNEKVELEKKWETSWQRKIGIIITTYIVMVLIFSGLKNSAPFTSAIIPTLGYTLSTLSMSWIKNLWLLRK